MTSLPTPTDDPAFIAARAVLAKRIHDRAVETCQGEPIWPEIRAIVDELTRLELRVRELEGRSDDGDD